MKRARKAGVTVIDNLGRRANELRAEMDVDGREAEGLKTKLDENHDLLLDFSIPISVGTDQLV
jgi:hypothetical protein